MKRIGKTIMVLFTILMLVSIPVSYAISKENENQSFIEVNKQEISVGETLEIQINLNQIQWSQIRLTLSSSWDMSSIYSDGENGVDIKKEKEEVILEMDKSKINLEKMVLYYPIAQETEEGTTFTLQGVIENLEQNDESQTETRITSEITVKIVTNNMETKEPEENEDKQKEMEKENGQNSNKGEMEIQMKQTSRQTTNTSLQAKSTNYNSENVGTEEKVSYHGSDNNYLSNMTINGYTLNKEFNKESSTYFVTVGQDTNRLEVVTSVEDSSATVCIAGADNLKEGENKILISVTAENGNVRNYRIYVTKG